MNKGLTKSELFDFLIKEANENFSGWDFSYIQETGRMREFPLNWSYRNKILKEIINTETLLDMGTGGGEFLASLGSIAKYACATEAYEPNVAIARERLGPLGMKVFAVQDGESLPFENEQFELIINRHESYTPKELIRILKPKGIFITQQVGGQNDKEINELLGVTESEYIGWDLKTATAQLIDEGFKVLEEKQEFTRTRFFDIGAIVYYLKAIPWQIPDFSVQKYFHKLLNIHNIIEKVGYIDFTCHRFLIKAEK